MKYLHKSTVCLGILCLFVISTTLQGLAQSASGSATNSTAATGNYSNAPSNPTGEGPGSTGGLYRTAEQATGLQNPQNSQSMPQAWTSLMAPDSVNTKPIPSGSYSLGFPRHGSTTYLGVDFSQAASVGGTLPQTSTCSTDLNIIGNGGTTTFGGSILEPTFSNPVTAVTNINAPVAPNPITDPWAFFGVAP